MPRRLFTTAAVLALGCLQLASSAPFYTEQLVIDMNPNRTNFLKHHYYCAVNLPLRSFTPESLEVYISTILVIAHTTEDALKNRPKTTEPPRLLLLTRPWPRDSATTDPASDEYYVIKDRLNDMGLKTVIMIPPEEGWHLTPTENLYCPMVNPGIYKLSGDSTRTFTASHTSATPTTTLPLTVTPKTLPATATSCEDALGGPGATCASLQDYCNYAELPSVATLCPATCGKCKTATTSSPPKGTVASSTPIPPTTPSTESTASAAQSSNTPTTATFPSKVTVASSTPIPPTPPTTPNTESTGSAAQSSNTPSMATTTSAYATQKTTESCNGVGCDGAVQTTSTTTASTMTTFAPPRSSTRPVNITTTASPPRNKTIPQKLSILSFTLLCLGGIALGVLFTLGCTHGYKRLELIVAKVARNCSTRICCFSFRPRHAIPRGYERVVNVGGEFDAESQILEDKNHQNPDDDIANLDDLPLPGDYHLENRTNSTAEYALTMNPAYLEAQHDVLAMTAQQVFEMDPANLAAHQRALAMNPDYALAMEAMLNASSVNPAYLGAQYDALAMAAQQVFEP